MYCVLNSMFSMLLTTPSPQMEDQKTMLTQQSEQLRHLHEEKQAAQILIEKFQNHVAELEASVSLEMLLNYTK